MKEAILVFILLVISTNFVYAEEVFITLSTRLDDVNFDGKWSYPDEWKPASLVTVDNNDSSFVYRVAHDYDNMFVYVSAISDKTPKDAGFFLFPETADNAIVCIDGKNNNAEKPDSDDYCFIATVGTDKIVTLQGDNEDGSYKTIDNHPELIGVGATSSVYDRYSKIPHSSYEFKIPVEVFGRSDVYGFYVGIYDSDLDLQYGWPIEATKKDDSFVPNPNTWGQIISPDKTLPEFEIPLLIMSIMLILTVIMSKQGMNLFRISRI